jgi:hypothetical protein
VPIGALRDRGSDAEIHAASRLPVAFEVRQSRAGAPSVAAAIAARRPKIRLIAEQFAAPFVVPIKAAPLARNIDPETGGLPQPWPQLSR